jgi:hypothetical protein
MHYAGDHGGSLPIKRVMFPYNFVIFEQRNRASIRFGSCAFRPNDEQCELAHSFPHGYAFENHSDSPNYYSEFRPRFWHLKALETIWSGSKRLPQMLILSTPGGAKNEDLKSG